MLIFLVRLVTGIAARQLRKRIFRDTWYIGYRPIGSKQAGLAGGGIPPNNGRTTTFRIRRPPRGRYYADPFVVEDEGQHYVFFEDFEWAEGKGVISSIRLSGGEASDAPWVALEQPYHLSYPCLFKASGRRYMIPETGHRQSIELYSTVAFPNHWTLERVLMSGVDAVGPTVLEHDGQLWLFVNIAVPGASVMDELHLFYADAPESKWHPHPGNPVVSGVRRARPAGGVICVNAAMIRPSQDRSRRYGGAVVFDRIVRLTATEYSETPIGRLEPGCLRGGLATHTFNSDSKFEVVDEERHTFRPLNWVVDRVAASCR